MCNNYRDISCHDGLVRSFPSFLVVFLVNKSLNGRCFFLAMRFIIVSLDYT